MGAEIAQAIIGLKKAVDAERALKSGAGGVLRNLRRLNPPTTPRTKGVNPSLIKPKKQKPTPLFQNIRTPSNSGGMKKWENGTGPTPAQKKNRQKLKAMGFAPNQNTPKNTLVKGKKPSEFNQANKGAFAKPKVTNNPSGAPFNPHHKEKIKL